jgi:hypothetical protein
MVEACRSENRNSDDYQPVTIGAEERYSLLRYLPRSAVAGLISSNTWSHEKHFIVMSHYCHVTVKWDGREAPLPPIKGGRTNGRNRLLTGKIRQDFVH